jgi:competence protein ComEA
LLGAQVYRTRPAGARPAELQRQAILAQRIDLNRAGRVELMQVPGLGERLAERIETHRRQHGPFRRVEDLGDVPGIGPALVERVRPWVYVRADDSELAASLVAEPAEDLDQPAGPPADAARPPSKKEAAFTGRINVNTANPEELQRLPGIGPKLSQRIVQERQKSPFRSVEDLDRVPGIGPKTIEKLRPLVSVKDLQVVTAE